MTPALRRAVPAHAGNVIHLFDVAACVGVPDALGVSQLRNAVRAYLASHEALLAALEEATGRTLPRAAGAGGLRALADDGDDLCQLPIGEWGAA